LWYNVAVEMNMKRNRRNKNIVRGLIEDAKDMTEFRYQESSAIPADNYFKKRINNKKIRDNLPLYFPKQKIREFCRIHGITFLALFGSYARGDNNKDSDMDFLVKINSGKSLIDVIRVENKMADLFDKKVQFVEEDTVPLELKKTINKEKIVLYEER